MLKFVMVCLAAVVVAGMLGGASSAAAETYEPRFAERTQQRLKELAIPASDVKSVEIRPYRRKTDRTGPENLGMEAWVQLNSCSGRLVIFMDRTAFVRETYTRGDCQIEGVKSF